MTANQSAIETSYDLAQPDPSSLVESLRAYGYTIQTAIADLIDNSIAAKAKNIWVHFEWDGPSSWVKIKDDGQGMMEDELVAAMHLGSQNPLEERVLTDLGRFGMGLKTASFSHCRQLTVVSKVKNKDLAARRWDLDYINISKEWRLLKLNGCDSLAFLNETISEHGTIVLWQKMDRLIKNTRSDDSKDYKRFLETIAEVKLHLEMIFHRYLEDQNKLKIWINGRRLTAWDPFLSKENATQELPEEKLICNGKELYVSAYVLPHQSKISHEIHKRASGPNNWNSQQGFYVYRNERMLIGGDWLGLGFQKEEHHKLARIRIDLPNTMDSEWQLDVRKSRAKPPGHLRADLKRIASLTRMRAMEIYRHRGKVIARQNAQNFAFLWEQKVRHGKLFYSINRNHPLVNQVYRCGEKPALDALLSMIEECIPLSHILIKNSEEPENFNSPYENSPPEVLQNVLQNSFTALVNSGIGEEAAIKRLQDMDPFNLFPNFVEQFLIKLLQKKI